jgi:hypothetical protein
MLELSGMPYPNVAWYRDGAGSVTISPRQAAVRFGTQVTMTAEPEEHHSLVG